ncbi:DUF6192 family protein [Streptomyces sp. NPDC059850]|uniref:DUF6192 family protein n=1 Tax=Streptomyces sp. NPDC059850 TaxID=3346970 RepID=UPI003666E70C
MRSRAAGSTRRPRCGRRPAPHRVDGRCPGSCWTASRRPKEHRQAGVSFTVPRALGSTPDKEERFDATKTPPEGKNRAPPGLFRHGAPHIGSD